jgi:hypothetical protein
LTFYYNILYNKLTIKLKDTMATISSTQQRYPANWQSPNEVLKELYMPFIRKVQEVLPVLEVATLVGEYTHYNLHSNYTLWHRALQNLDLLPEKVPPLPPQIMEFFEQDCKVNPYRRPPGKIKETHFLCLAPVCTIDDLAIRIFGERHTDLYLADSSYGSMFHGITIFRQPHLVEFTEPEWFAVPTNGINIGSCGKTFREHIQMILNLRKSTGIDYTFPTFKHAIAANLLYYAINEESLWDTITGSRVYETFYCKSEAFALEKNLVVNSPCKKEGHMVRVRSLSSPWGGELTGVVPMWKISKPVPPPKPRGYEADCAIS